MRVTHSDRVGEADLGVEMDGQAVEEEALVADGQKGEGEAKVLDDQKVEVEAMAVDDQKVEVEAMAVDEYEVEAAGSVEKGDDGEQLHLCEEAGVPHHDPCHNVDIAPVQLRKFVSMSAPARRTFSIGRIRPLPFGDLTSSM